MVWTKIIKSWVNYLKSELFYCNVTLLTCKKCALFRFSSPKRNIYYGTNLPKNLLFLQLTVMWIYGSVSTYYRVPLSSGAVPWC